MPYNMMCSRTDLDAALLDPSYQVQDEARRALFRVFSMMDTPDAVTCFGCRRVFRWSDGARDDDILPAAYVHIERDKLTPASALLCRECNNDAGISRGLQDVFGAEDIQKYTPMHKGGTA